MAVAALVGTTAAQGTRADSLAAARRDSLRARNDSLRRPAPDTSLHAVPLPSDTAHGARDTTAADTIPKDTVKAPLAQPVMPPSLEVGAQYRWDRAALFASGALTLTDLLQRIPGITTFRTGWLASPQHAAYLGNPTRVRIFYDGVEIDPLDTRAGGVLDMAEIPLWSLQEVVIERGADELRIHLRSWTVDRTTAQTRTDVATGDQGTNLYRGFFGKRYKHGEIFQLGGQQYGTSSDPDVGGGSELSLLGRIGLARETWSFDAFAMRSSRTRDQQRAQVLVSGTSGLIPTLDRTRTDAYLRFALGRADSGGWAQLIAANEVWDEHSDRNTAGPAPVDTVDTLRAGAQYQASAGFTRGTLRVSATDRYHVLKAGNLNAISGRASFESGPLSLSLYAEHRGSDSSSSEEASIRLQPLSFFAISGAVSRRHGGADVNGVSVLSARGEAGVRIHRAWASAGVWRRGGVPIPALPAFDTAYVAAFIAPATGVYGAIRGKVFQDIGLDAWLIDWQNPGFYRPKVQSHAELYLDTRWLRRFPSGNFGFLASVAVDHRQDVIFPATGATETLDPVNITALFSNSLTTRLEVRIVDAVIFWNSYYGVNPPTLEYVPGFLQPRQRFVYGVRWEFWN